MSCALKNTYAEICGKRRISFAEYFESRSDEEGFRYGWAHCRECGREVVAICEWHEGDEEPVPMSSAGRRPCQNPKCGDKFPDGIFRMVGSAEHQANEEPGVILLEAGRSR